MPLSTYITEENVRFNGELNSAVVLDDTADVRTLVLTDTLSTSDSDALLAFLDANLEGDAPPLAGPTAGSASVAFASAAVGATVTGLSNVAATAGKLTITFDSAVAGGDSTGLRTTAGTAAYQAVDFGATKAGADATGLANTATVYTAKVTVDGVPKQISIVGSAAQTYTTLLAELNADLGSSAVAAISGGDVRITSARLGVESSVVIDPGTLFPAMTGYVAVLAKVAGTGSPLSYTALIYVDGVEKRISFAGSTAATFTNVLSEINTDLASSATAAISGGNVVITSATTGAASSVTLQDTGGLFGSMTTYAGATSTPGTAPVTYTATITVDGVAKPVSILGTAAQTFTPLVSAITTAVGAAGTVTFTGGVIKVVSATTGVASTVTVTDGNLFKNITGFAGVTTYTGIASLLAAFTAPLQFNSSARLSDRFNLVVVGDAPAIGPVPGKANLPLTSDYIYYGGSTLAWRYLADDSEFPA